MGTTNPTVSLRALGFQMRRYRLAREIKLDVAAKVAAVAPSSLSKAETGKQALNPVLVEKLLDHYGVTDVEERERCLHLAKQGRKRAWWSPFTDLVNAIYTGLEGGAERICYLENQIVPGLLQTPDYFAALARTELPAATDDELKRRAEVRVARQSILTQDEDPCELLAVLDEAILYRPIGSPEVMAAQLDHLLSIAKLPNVEIQIMAFASGAHANLGTKFTILRFADVDDPGTVYLEQLHYRDVFVEEAADVRAFLDAFGRSQAAAETPSRSLAMIKQARDGFRSRKD